MGIFSDAQGQLTHKSPDQILPPFEPIRDFMGVLVPARRRSNKNEGARVVTTLFIYFSHAQGQLTPKLVMESC